MAITQDRLITAVALARKYMDLLTALKRECGEVSAQIIRAENPELKAEWTRVLVNTILDVEVDAQEYLSIREEEIHFKFARKRNIRQNEYTKRWRARNREHDESLRDNYVADAEVDALFGGPLACKDSARDDSARDDSAPKANWRSAPEVTGLRVSTPEGIQDPEGNPKTKTERD